MDNKDISTRQAYIKCPFCVDGNINAEPGKSEKKGKGKGQKRGQVCF